MTPRFSVIIPAHNAACTLARAIESVHKQTWPAHQIIVVDDGSQDHSASIAEAFGNTVTLIRQPNAGVSAARNAGARAASGDWLAFLDADDWYYPDRLKLHAEWIASDASLDFLTGDYEYRDASDVLLGTSMVQHESGRMMLAKRNTRVLLDAPSEVRAFVADHFGDTHTLSVPLATFIALGGYPAGYKVCEDVHFLIRLVAKSHRIGVVCTPLAVYLIHEGSATRRNPVAAQQENVRTLTDLATLTKTLPEPVRRGVQERMQNARYNLACALTKNGERYAAVKAILPSLISQPSWRSLRDVLSVIRG